MNERAEIFIQPASVKTCRCSGEPDMATLLPGPSVHTAPGFRGDVVRFVPDDEVRRGEAGKATSEGIDRTDGNSLVRIELTSGGNEAMGHSCEGESC
jgi:hypothetical protein